MISFIAIAFGVFLFGIGFAIGYDVSSNVQFALGIILAIVPEGLPITITVSLSVAAKKLSRLKVLVKNLESVETLGSTSCICSDKTGTLTQNIMTVEHIWVNDKVHKEYKEEFEELRKCAVVNSTAVFTENPP